MKLNSTTKDKILERLYLQTEGMTLLETPGNKLGQELAPVIGEEALKMRRFFLDQDDDILSSIWECFSNKDSTLQEIHLDFVLFLIQVPTYKLQISELLGHIETILTYMNWTIGMMHEEQKKRAAEPVEIVEIQVELEPVAPDRKQERDDDDDDLGLEQEPIELIHEAEDSPKAISEREHKQREKLNGLWNKTWKPEFANWEAPRPRSSRKARKTTPYDDEE